MPCLNVPTSSAQECQMPMTLAHAERRGATPSEHGRHPLLTEPPKRLSSKPRRPWRDSTLYSMQTARLCRFPARTRARATKHALFMKYPTHRRFLDHALRDRLITTRISCAMTRCERRTKNLPWNAHGRLIWSRNTIQAAVYIPLETFLKTFFLPSSVWLTMVRKLGLVVL